MNFLLIRLVNNRERDAPKSGSGLSMIGFSGVVSVGTEDEYGIKETGD